MVWFKLARSRVVPEATVNALAAENAFAAPACSVPALTAVAPEYVPAPDSVSVPMPILVSDPVPLIAPLKARSSLRLNVSAALLTISPTIDPVGPPLPICSVPPLIVVPPV
jgi:hypothetical protein